MEEEAKELQCKRCGKHFACDVTSISRCQCNTITLSNETHAFLENTLWGCLCINCLSAINEKVVSIQGKTFPSPEEVEEGVHYYLENGFWVFTELYHMLRGRCCKSGCRHCAYGYKKVTV
jgi:hypothetical protein